MQELIEISWAAFNTKAKKWVIELMHCKKQQKALTADSFLGTHPYFSDSMLLMIWSHLMFTNFQKVGSICGWNPFQVIQWVRELGLKFRSFSQYTLVALVVRAGITQGKPPTIELANLRHSSKQVSFFFFVLLWLGLLAFLQVCLHMAPWDIPFKDCGSFGTLYLCGQNQEPEESMAR